MSRIMHPRLLQSLQRDFFTQLCTIRQNTPTQNNVGQMKDAWANVEGMTALPCRVGGISGGERRTSAQTYLDATHKILIAGHYPSITEKQQALVDGQIYDIILPQASPDETVTRLIARIVR
jgi:head-tail adaptor